MRWWPPSGLPQGRGPLAVSPEVIYIQITLYSLSRLHLGIYKQRKRDHKFGREQGGSWKGLKGREGRDYVTVLQFQKKDYTKKKDLKALPICSILTT